MAKRSGRITYDTEEIVDTEHAKELAEEIADLMRDPRCEGFDGLTVQIERKPN